MERKRFTSLFILVLAIFLIWNGVFASGNSGLLKIDFLDVGQGDAVFFETPNGTQILYDGGPDRKVLNELGKEMGFFDKTIDFVFFSHPDQDHIAGLIPVFDKYEILNVVASGVEGNTEIYRTLLQRIEKEGANFTIATTGTVFDFGDGVVARVLFPDRLVKDMETNVGSLVVQFDFNDIEVLLTGDSPGQIEKYLMNLYGEKLQSEILKAGHHGSKTSNTEEFLADVSPEYFVISVGADNKYGHPNSEVLDILNKLGLDFLRTDEEGNITFFTDGERIWR